MVTNIWQNDWGLITIPVKDKEKTKAGPPILKVRLGTRFQLQSLG